MCSGPTLRCSSTPVRRKQQAYVAPAKAQQCYVAVYAFGIEFPLVACTLPFSIVCHSVASATPSTDDIQLYGLEHIGVIPMEQIDPDTTGFVALDDDETATLS